MEGYENCGGAPAIAYIPTETPFEENPNVHDLQSCQNPYVGFPISRERQYRPQITVILTIGNLVK